MQKILKYQAPTLIWGLFIFILCTIKLGGVGNSPMFFAGFDKLVHCGLFFVLTIFLGTGIARANALQKLTYIQLFLSLLIPFLFGGLIELLQAYVFTWRSGEWGDLFADSVGTGMAVFGILITIWALKNEKKHN